jgi:acyl-CoA synthetase (AMP-forming)/AMP-acid ligase II
MGGFQRKEIFYTDFISLNAKWYPDKPAVVFGEERLTWGEFNRRINRVANSLIETGIKKGDMVAILSDNCMEYPEIMLGIVQAGAAIVPLSTMLQSDVITLELEDIKPRAIFVGSSYLHCLEAYKERSNDIPLRNYILIDGKAEGHGCYEEFLSMASGEDPHIGLSYDDTYNIMLSSGTTGTPKGVVHTHYSRLFTALTLGLEFRIHNESVTIITTPFYTSGTPLVFLPTFLVCGAVVIMPKFDPKNFLELVQREKGTHTFMVPTQFIRIMAHPEFSNYDTSSMEIMLCAAAPLMRSTKLEILQKFPNTKLVELYGVSEAIGTILRPDEQLSKIGSVGKSRMGGDIKIIDDMGRELPRGQIGEIVGGNVAIMKEYFQKPDLTKEAMWLDQEGREYVKTGDIGRFDEDGYLYILDRKKDMIISGGINIFPSDIEETIMRHPDVADAAVIGILHKEWGETPLALVVKKKGAAVVENELKEWVNEQLAKYQRVSAVQFLDSIPRTDQGKALKRELRERYVKNLEK